MRVDVTAVQRDFAQKPERIDAILRSETPHELKARLLTDHVRLTAESARWDKFFAALKHLDGFDSARLHAATLESTPLAAYFRILIGSPRYSKDSIYGCDPN